MRGRLSPPRNADHTSILASDGRGVSTTAQVDSLHRLAKHAIDSGRAASVADAEAMLQQYCLSVEIDGSQASDPVAQATLLTLVAVARRVFLGGVRVRGALGAELVVPLPFGRTLSEATRTLGARLGASAGGTPTVVVGGGPVRRRDGFFVRTAAAGWRGGVLPAGSELEPEPGPAVPLAGMLAGALAVSEAFFFVSGCVPVAGHRAVGLSLWRPDPGVDWLLDACGEKDLTYLPSRLWLIGLGACSPLVGSRCVAAS